MEENLKLQWVENTNDYGIGASIDESAKDNFNKIANGMIKSFRDGFRGYMESQLVYYREHGHFPEPTEQELFRKKLFFAKTVSGDLILTNPETMQSYVTHQQSGNYELIYPLQPINIEFERWARSMDF